MATTKTGIKIVSKKVVDLDYDEYIQCLHTNLQGRGQMQSVVASARHYPEKFNRARAIMLYDESAFIGWALLFQYNSNIPWKSDITGYFYVKRKYRRKGYGIMLRSQILKYIRANQKVYFQPWDERSRSFFESGYRSMKVKVLGA